MLACRTRRVEQRRHPRPAYVDRHDPNSSGARDAVLQCGGVPDRIADRGKPELVTVVTGGYVGRFEIPDPFAVAPEQNRT